MDPAQKGQTIERRGEEEQKKEKGQNTGWDREWDCSVEETGRESSASGQLSHHQQLQCECNSLTSSLGVCEGCMNVVLILVKKP